jgi:hypothetical protein
MQSAASGVTAAATLNANLTIEDAEKASKRRARTEASSLAGVTADRVSTFPLGNHLSLWVTTLLSIPYLLMALGADRAVMIEEKRQWLLACPRRVGRGRL